VTAGTLVTCAAGALAGFVAARILVSARLLAPPSRTLRTNVRGRRVPVVLGAPLALGGLAALALVSVAGAVGWEPGNTGASGAAVALCVIVMAIAGGWDDRRGDESERGFAGHLRAALSGRLTGGMVKVLAGGAVGLAAGVMTGPAPRAALTAAAVALGANFLNLTDRAPGRAGKVFLVLCVPLVVAGDVAWAVAASCVAGAELACLSADLEERAMLGDAGSNPLGAVVGLGVALSFPLPGALVAVALLLMANLASERWSFSRGIERVAWLKAVDQLGRK
jgi:UDP-GlcNAc:undecaprenyl-phosphate/decaprenyl-phosphate GlcNAc-1-phosphate transferase